MIAHQCVRQASARSRLGILGCAFVSLTIGLGHPAVAREESSAATAPAIPANQLAARPGLNTMLVEGVDLGYRPLVGPSLLQDENFYFLTLLEQVPDANRAMRAEPGLETIRQAVVARVTAAVEACQAEYSYRGADPQEGRQAACTPHALRLTDTERQQSIAAIGRLYDRSPAVRRLVTGHMRPSGRFHRDAELNDRALFIKAWSEALDGVDRIIRVYGLGEKPRYADIDSIIYDANSRYYRSVLALSIWEVGREVETTPTAYRPALDYALALMEINRRDDAVRQLKLQETTNAATFAYLAGVRWGDYLYAAIIVPGWSPMIAYEPLNPGRKVALRTAVRLFRAGRAPLIIVSGAQLRPIGTEWAEAFEMKAYLVEELGIPSDRVLINPLSRHTTTEIRDNGRMLFRTGAPLDKKSLYISEGAYIGSKELEDRFLRDQGYLPWTLLERQDFTTLEFIPTLKSLHREATDPMNP